MTMSEIIILNEPKEVIQHIDKRMAEDRFAHIQIRSFENKGIFESWISQARLWYDPNICSCRKKGLTEEIIINRYKELSNLTQAEKNKAYRILGSPVVLKFGGETIITLP